MGVRKTRLIFLLLIIINNNNNNTSQEQRKGYVKTPITLTLWDQLGSLL